MQDIHFQLHLKGANDKREWEGEMRTGYEDSGQLGGCNKVALIGGYIYIYKYEYIVYLYNYTINKTVDSSLVSHLHHF